MFQTKIEVLCNELSQACHFKQNNRNGAFNKFAIGTRFECIMEVCKV